MTKPDISREAVERLARQVEFRLNHQLGATGATNTMILALRALRDELDRVTARVAELEAALSNTACYGCSMRIGDPQPRFYVCASCSAKRKLLGISALRTDKWGRVMTILHTTMDRLKRAMADKPDARQVTLNRSTVEAMLAALDGTRVTTISDAASLIQRQRYSAVESALAAAEGKMGEDAVTCFLNALRYADED